MLRTSTPTNKVNGNGRQEEQLAGPLQTQAVYLWDYRHPESIPGFIMTSITTTEVKYPALTTGSAEHGKEVARVD